MKSFIKILALGILTVHTSCESVSGYQFEKGSLPVSPINLENFNTEFDDYNSTAPSLGELIPFCFSTNRNSFGNRFDVIYLPMNVNFDKSTGKLNVTNQYANWSSLSDDYNIIKTGISKTRTTGNELGPNLIIERDFNDLNFSLLYSTDVTGNFQINFISNLTEDSFSEPLEVNFLNSEFDDMYPAFNSDRSEIYFCSNRNENNFDFFKVNVNPELDSEKLFLDTSSYEVKMLSSLSSHADDKCPFIFEDKMVFASNRAGGFGGYDLYYSELENGKWSEPINFGEEINTASDEYRPILINEGVSPSQTMMVFSSDRIGGLGGFDLYFVGVENE